MFHRQHDSLLPHILVSSLRGRSLCVAAKVVPVQRGPESHKVSVVLLKCCSILFICKCCNLSVNVVNTNERATRRGKPPQLFPPRTEARVRPCRVGAKRCPKITHRTRACPLYGEGGRGHPEVFINCTVVAPHMPVCLHSQPNLRYWLVIYNRA